MLRERRICKRGGLERGLSWGGGRELGGITWLASCTNHHNSV